MKISLKGKIVLLVLFPAVILTLFSIFGMKRVNNKVFENMDGSELKMRELQKLEVITAHYGKQVQEWKNILLRGHDVKKMEKYLDGLKNSSEVIKTTVDELKGLFKNEPEKIALMESFMQKQEKLIEGYLESHKKHLSSNINDFKAADKAVSGLDRGGLDTIKELSSILNNDMVEATKGTHDFLEQEMGIFGLVTAAIFLVTFFVSLYLITRMTDQLTGMSKNLESSSKGLDTYAKTLSQRGASLAEAVAEQASGLQETVATINEINSMVKRNAQGAQSSLELSKESRSVAERGKQTVNEMVGSINGIKDSNSVIMLEMSKSNDEISQIINLISEIDDKTKVINDIVFQTKLLSFNASVEAARAGEHGKGFSVVAEEVGNLATMSGKSATEITEVLEASIKKVKDIVDKSKQTIERLTQQGLEKAEHGTRMAQECGSVFENVLENVIKVNTVVEEIAHATQEQAAGIEEVNRAVSQLDEVTQQNSGIANETSTISSKVRQEASDLSTLSLDLRDLLDGKTIKKHQHFSKSNVLELNKHQKMNVKKSIVEERQSENIQELKLASGGDSGGRNFEDFEEI